MAQDAGVRGNETATGWLKESGGLAQSAGELAILDALPAHSVLLDEHGRIVAANAAWHAFARANGASPARVGPGVNYLQICDAATGSRAAEAPVFAAGLRDVLAGRREAFALTYPCDSPTERRWFLARIALVRGGAVRALVTHELTTAPGRLGRMAREAGDDNADLHRRLREAIADRDDFLTVAAHELRTPITSLRGAVQLLLRRLERGQSVDPARQRALLATIDQQAARLTHLIAQLIDVARIEERQLLLERTPVEIGDLLGGVVERLRGGASRHTLLLNTVPGMVAWVDPARLEQVIEHLIGNAIAYSPEGGPIEISATVSDGTLEIAIGDRGIGIPPERRARVFDRFARAHADQHLGGLGLGLYLSRQIVLLHGGTIEAQDGAGGGTRMVARLPLTPSDQEGQ